MKTKSHVLTVTFDLSFFVLRITNKHTKKNEHELLVTYFRLLFLATIEHNNSLFTPEVYIWSLHLNYKDALNQSHIHKQSPIKKNGILKSTINIPVSYTKATTNSRSKK